MFILFMIPSFRCGETDPEMERANEPGWADPWFGERAWDDVQRDPGNGEGRFEWRPQRIVCIGELQP